MCFKVFSMCWEICVKIELVGFSLARLIPRLHLLSPIDCVESGMDICSIYVLHWNFSLMYAPSSMPMPVMHPCCPSINCLGSTYLARSIRFIQPSLLYSMPLAAHAGYAPSVRYSFVSIRCHQSIIQTFCSMCFHWNFSSVVRSMLHARYAGYARSVDEIDCSPFIARSQSNRKNQRMNLSLYSSSSFLALLSTTLH